MRIPDIEQLQKGAVNALAMLLQHPVLCPLSCVCFKRRLTAEGSGDSGYHVQILQCPRVIQRECLHVYSYKQENISKNPHDSFLRISLAKTRSYSYF